MYTPIQIKELARQLALLIMGEVLKPRWLTIKEACDYTKIKRDTLMRFIEEGDIYAVKKRGKWVIDRESIDAFYSSDRIAI